jgi:hypothetical protein
MLEASKGAGIMTKGISNYQANWTVTQAGNLIPQCVDCAKRLRRASGKTPMLICPDCKRRYSSRPPASAVAEARRQRGGWDYDTCHPIQTLDMRGMRVVECSFVWDGRREETATLRLSYLKQEDDERQEWDDRRTVVYHGADAIRVYDLMREGAQYL